MYLSWNWAQYFLRVYCRLLKLMKFIWKIKNTGCLTFFIFLLVNYPLINSLNTLRQFHPTKRKLPFLFLILRALAETISFWISLNWRTVNGGVSQLYFQFNRKSASFNVYGAVRMNCDLFDFNWAFRSNKGEKYVQ